MTTGTAVPSIQFTSAGFVSPSGPSVLAGVQLDISNAFGGALNYGLTTPQGQLASSWGAIIVNANSIFVYYAQQVDPAYASGRFQDAIGRIYRLERQPAVPTSVQISCNGANEVAIPLNSQVRDTAGNLYQCTQAGTIGSGGSVVLAFAAVNAGPTPVPASVTLYQVTPGWDSASVISGAVGRNVESRSEFETRRIDSVAGNSFGAIGSIIGAVANVPGVIDYFGYNNNTSGTVTVGTVSIAAYSIYICVAGGSPSAVAQAILSKKGAGAPMVGNTTVTVYDSNPLYATPIAYVITYEIPTALQILFKVGIVAGPTVPSSAVQQVQTALLAAFTGNTLAASFTGQISGTTLTVSAVVSGTLAVGQTISDLTGNLAADTVITGLGTGTGGTGTYLVSVNQNVVAEAMTSAAPITGTSTPRARINSVINAIQYVPAIAALGPWALVSSLTVGSANSADAVVVGHIAANTLTVTAVTSGTVVVGDFLFDAAGLIINGTVITALGTGTGGTGTYTINNPQTVAGATFTGNTTGSSVNLTTSAVTGTIGVGNTITGSGVPGGTTIVSQTSGTPGGAGVYVMSAAASLTNIACTANETITCASPAASSVTVQANQIPQLTSADIVVSVA